MVCAWRNFKNSFSRPLFTKGGIKSEDTGEFLHCQHLYSKSLSRAENLNFPPKTVNNLFKFSAQDSDLEYLCWQWKNSPVSSDLKPPVSFLGQKYYFLSHRYSILTGQTKVEFVIYVLGVKKVKIQDMFIKSVHFKNTVMQSSFHSTLVLSEMRIA